jgi:hypothetical protein
MLLSLMFAPLFIAAGEDAVALYTEEADVARLQVVQCATGSVSDLRVDSLGRQQWFEETATGFALHPSEPPRPAGLAQTASGILWATHVVAGADSLTLVSLLRADDDVQRVVALKGWFQMLDSEPDVRLVLGSDHPVPRVLIVRTGALLDAMERYGVERPIGRPHG